MADDGKSVEGVVANFGKWRCRPSRLVTEKLFRRHSGANIAILPYLCRPRLVIPDCDDAAALAAVEREQGSTPLVVRTPRGTGWHPYYRAPDGPVGQRNLRRSRGLAIDIKAGPGAVVIVPPSIRPSTGRCYVFARGDWSLLSRLPVFRPIPEERALPMSGKVREGCRNDHLFSELLRRARRYGCDGLGHMKEVAHALNERDNDPPLSWAEVEKTAKSAWEIHDRGDNWVGREPRLVVAKPDFLALLDHPEALALWMYLRFSHQGLNDTFAVSAKAMAARSVIPGWSVQAYRKAKNVLVDRGFLSVVHEGGRGPGDPDLFALRAGAGGKGADLAPNTNETPSPAPGQAPPAARPRRKVA
jgi:hypothetical protein